MNKIIYGLHYLLCKGNKVQLLATLTLFYYNKMKRLEQQFKNYRSMLMYFTAPNCTIKTVYGTVEVNTTRKAILDVQQLIKTLPVEKLMEMSQVRVNLVMKQLGQQFDTVVKNWYDSKNVLFIK